MLRRYASYYPLALALLFGLAISFIPVSPALSDNITACQGSGNLSTKLTLGGRSITPTLILQAATGSACPTGETGLGLVTLSRTIIVSPVVTATQNGTALLAAMTVIANSSPSLTNPWLLKLEPGQYDLGNQSLTLQPYVDLEGSGEGITIISSTVRTSCCNPPTTGTLVAASHSEVRLVTVANAGSSTSVTQVAIYVPVSATSARFSHLTASASTSTAGGTYSYGLYSDGTTTVQNSTITAAGGTFSYGVDSFGTTTVQNSTLTASGSNTSIGLASSGVLVQNSTLTASGGTTSYGLENFSGTAKVGASQLAGSTAASSGVSLCPASYNGSTFQPLNASCQ